VSTLDAPLPVAPVVPGGAPHMLVVRAPYYRAVVDGMTEGALRILREAGATCEVLDVAGAFELPQAIRLALRGGAVPRWQGEGWQGAGAQGAGGAGGAFDGYVALGCVIRGGTDHYDHICRETMAGLMAVALQFGIALGSGLLTVHSLEQAVARSGTDGHNKGAEAAAAALGQVAVARRFGGGR